MLDCIPVGSPEPTNQEARHSCGPPPPEYLCHRRATTPHLVVIAGRCFVRRVRPRAAISRSWRWASAIVYTALVWIILFTSLGSIPQGLSSERQVLACIGTGSGKALFGLTSAGYEKAAESRQPPWAA